MAAGTVFVCVCAASVYVQCAMPEVKFRDQSTTIRNTNKNETATTMAAVPWDTYGFVDQ